MMARETWSHYVKEADSNFLYEYKFTGGPSFHVNSGISSQILDRHLLNLALPPSFEKIDDKK